MYGTKVILLAPTAKTILNETNLIIPWKGLLAPPLNHARLHYDLFLRFFRGSLHSHLPHLFVIDGRESRHSAPVPGVP